MQCTMHMTAPSHRIVVALDLTEYSAIVLEHAIAQAAEYAAGALHAVHVLEKASVDPAPAKAALAALVAAGTELIHGADWRVHLHICDGKIAETVTDLAAEQRAHLLVVGRFGSRHPHRSIGYTASEIIERAPCPTLVVPLVDQTSDSLPQCAACVTLRQQTAGHAWFCGSHTARDRRWLSTTVSPGSTWTGGLMW